MLYYIKEKKALNTAEDSTHTLHNTYSLRGAKIRDPLAWSKYLNEALALWGDDVQVMYAMHHRSEEHTSELQSLLRISYAVFCLKKQNISSTTNHINSTTPPYTHTHL